MAPMPLGSVSAKRKNAMLSAGRCTLHTSKCECIVFVRDSDMATRRIGLL